MKMWHWQWLFMLLCVWDTFATQTILSCNITGEGNPLMDTVIKDSGWTVVWAIKIGFGSIFIYALPSLWKYLWGKVLVSIAYSTYLFVASVHLFILHLP